MQPVAWPIRPDYAAGLSYWIYTAEKKYGLKVESLKEDYDAKTEQPMCNAQFSPQEGDSDEYTEISLSNLFLPCLLWGSFAIVAFGLQLYVARMKTKKKHGRGSLLNSNLIGRNSSLGLVRSFTKRQLDIKDDPDFPADLRVAMDQPTGVPNVLGLEDELQLEDTSYHTAEDENVIAEDNIISEGFKDRNGQLHAWI